MSRIEKHSTSSRNLTQSSSNSTISPRSRCLQVAIRIRRHSEIAARAGENRTGTENGYETATGETRYCTRGASTATANSLRERRALRRHPRMQRARVARALLSTIRFSASHRRQESQAINHKRYTHAYAQKSAFSKRDSRER